MAMRWVLIAVLGAGCRPTATASPDQGAAVKPSPPPTDPRALAAGPEPKPPAALEPPAVPDVHPDGTWSIRGLRRDLDKQIERGDAEGEVMVSGYVFEIYEPPPCPDGDTCPPPKRPHFWLVDRLGDDGKPDAMLVTTYRFTLPASDTARWKDLPDVAISQGDKVVLKGLLRRVSTTGFGDNRGLLEFRALGGPGKPGHRWIYPRGAPWHPIEVWRSEEKAAREREAKRGKSKRGKSKRRKSKRRKSSKSKRK